jgi:NADH-quinone oxidoreductase subunit N
MIQSSIDFVCILPELNMLILINVFILFALGFSTYNGKIVHSEHIDFRLGYQITPLQISQVLCDLVVLSLLFTLGLYANAPISNSVILTDSFICDHLATLTKVLVCISSAAAIALGSHVVKRFSSYEFVILCYMAILSMQCLISSYSFLSFYLAVELQSLCFYMLAGMRSSSEFSTEASLKYFILGAFSSAILLLGISLIYGTIGSIYFADVSLFLHHLSSAESIQSVTQPWLGLIIGLGCILISLLFKLGAAPFHTWVADVYEGSGTNITAFFAICAKIGVLSVLIRLTLASQDHILMLALAYASGLSLFVGSLSAMRQTKIKRLLALSGVANVGWFLLALASGQWEASVLHLIVYITLSITLFSIFITPLFRSHPNLQYRVRSEAKLGITDHGADANTFKHISDLQQIYKTNPTLAFALALAMFSLAGIPPLAGFYSKYIVIQGVVQSEQYVLLFLALGVAVISAFYYCRVVKVMYFTCIPNQNWFSMQIPSVINAYLISTTSLITVLFMAQPDYVTTWLVG